VVGTVNFVNEMLNTDVNNFVFASTVAIFGNPVTEKIAQDHPRNSGVASKNSKGKN